ncbi:MAG: RNA polymerase sigma factor [Clostridia bacterium]|nr:RNA polymerase sigma factor [Clostridia bacterium]
MKQHPEHDAILSCYDDLLRLALSKCGHQQDAEDLVSETMLAAYAYLHRGGVIEYPRTWLANTLLHKHNSSLRKKYRTPVSVSPDALFDMADDSEARAEEAFLATEEAARVRRELCYLGELHRKVLLRHYFYGESVAEIAEALQIPQGTVKSRLAAGRDALRVRMTKGMEENMENKKYPLPGRLDVTWSGRDGPMGEPASLVNNDLIAENLLILAYNAPLTLPELADNIGIPTVYIEPIVRKLVNSELMAETEAGKVYTNFMIYFPDTDRVYARYKEQLAFVDKHFEGIAEVIARLTKDVADFAETLPAERKLSSRAAMKLERYAVTKALQNFELNGQSRYDGGGVYKPRPDGGAWMAFAWARPGDHKHDERIDEMGAYYVNGGHRTSRHEWSFNGRKTLLHLCEFDTYFWDHPCRYHGTCDMKTYFRYIHPLLWQLHKGYSVEESQLPDSVLEGIPQFIERGILVREGDRLLPDIPILTEAEYAKLDKLIQQAVESLKSTIGAPFHEYLKGAAEWVPPHLDREAVPDIYRYKRATICFVMAAVRKAHEAGIHMKGVDYCCPPMVMIYRENT